MSSITNVQTKKPEEKPASELTESRRDRRPWLSAQDVVSALKKLGPATREDIAQVLNVKPNVVGNQARKLERFGIIKRLMITVGHRGANRFGYNDLFDNSKLPSGCVLLMLAHDNEQLEQLGKMLVSAINPDMKGAATNGMKAAMTQHLRAAGLPEEIVHKMKEALDKAPIGRR